jgi:hypothetical protein
MIKQKILGSVMVAGIGLALAACGAEGGDSLTGPGIGLSSDDGTGSTSSGGFDGSGSSNRSNDSQAGELRLRCEVRTGQARSRISVDGKNLASGQYRARVRSGSNTATSGLGTTVGDEVEFDFDSDPDDIAAGATAIASDFIDTSADPDVVAEVLDASGGVLVTHGGNCSVRR